MKKRTGKFLWILMLLPVLLLASCGKAKELTSDELLKEVIAGQEKLKTGKMNMTMEFSADIPLGELEGFEGAGEDASMGMGMTMDADMDYQEDRARTKGNVTIDMMSMKIPVDFETYTVKNDGGYVTYTNNAGQWSKSEVEAGDANIGAMALTGKTLYQEIGENASEMEIQTLDSEGIECYVIHSEIGGDIFNSIMDSAGQLPNQDGALIDMDLSGQKAKIDLYVDKEKKQVVKMEMDMGEMAQKMMEDSMGAAGLGQSFKVNKFQLSVTVKEQGGSVDIQIPDEAKNAS